MRGRLTYDPRPCERKVCPNDIPKKRKGAVKDMPWSQYKKARFCGPECVQLYRQEMGGWAKLTKTRANSRRMKPIILKPIDYFLMGRGRKTQDG